MRKTASANSSNSALALPGIELLPCSIEITVASYHQLAKGYHGDPADRILLATASLEELTLVTRDKKILDYAAKNSISAIAA